MGFIHKNNIIKFSRILFGLLFIFSSGFKLFDLESFREAIVSFKLIGGYSVDIVKYLIPILELILGILIILKIYTENVVETAIGLLTFFTAVIIAKLLEGEDISCKCFGGLSDGTLDGVSVLRNIFLILWGFVIILLEHNYKNTKHRDRLIKKGFYKTVIMFLIFYLCTQNLVLAFQNYKLKESMRFILENEDILKTGDTVLPFRAVDINKNEVDIDFKKSEKKYTLLFILSSECKFCKGNIISWNKIATDLNRSDIEFIGILIDGQKNLLQFKNLFNVKFNILKTVDGLFIKNYKCEKVPQTILIDNNGIVIRNIKGKLSRDQLNELTDIITKLKR